MIKEAIEKITNIIYIICFNYWWFNTRNYWFNYI